MPKSPNFFIEFLKLTKLFWCSSRKVKIRGMFVLFAMLTVMQMVMAVLMTQWSAGLFDALERHSMKGFFVQVGLLSLLFVADVTLTGSHLEVKRNLQMLWRTWLTDYVFSRWMENGRHYLIAHMPGEHDNPDGRIAEDCRVATESAVVLVHTLFYSILLLAGFTKVLWAKSGVVTLDLGFAVIPIYGHLIWVAIIYTALASWIGWKVSQPLTGATNVRQSAEAKFRAGLLEAQENSQAIALIHAEPCERRQFRMLFCKIRKVWDEQTKAWRNIVMFGTGYSVLSMAFPILVVAPRYILGKISLGDLMQSAQAFQHMTGALSWPVNNLGGIAEWRASVERVLGLLNTLENVDKEVAKTDHWIQVQCGERPILAFRNLSIAKYEGQVLAEGINMEINQGDRVLITGNLYNGAKLFRAIAGIRPWGSGIIELPSKGRLFFMPPRPHLPTGTLQEAVWYPALRRKFTREQIEEAMKLVGLDHLINQLDTEDNWQQTLTRGEQQRLGVVRLLINQPQWIFLQEAFDSLKPEDEEQILQLICKQLPNATLLAISHTPETSTFYTRHLTL
jgi:putative ATP-binding cassette transporter